MGDSLLDNDVIDKDAERHDVSGLSAKLIKPFFAEQF